MVPDYLYDVFWMNTETINKHCISSFRSGVKELSRC